MADQTAAALESNQREPPAGPPVSGSVANNGPLPLRDSRKRNRSSESSGSASPKQAYRRVEGQGERPGLLVSRASGIPGHPVARSSIKPPLPTSVQSGPQIRHIDGLTISVPPYMVPPSSASGSQPLSQLPGVQPVVRESSNDDALMRPPFSVPSQGLSLEPNYAQPDFNVSEMESVITQFLSETHNTSFPPASSIPGPQEQVSIAALFEQSCEQASAGGLLDPSSTNGIQAPPFVDFVSYEHAEALAQSVLQEWQSLVEQSYVQPPVDSQSNAGPQFYVDPQLYIDPSASEVPHGQGPRTDEGTQHTQQHDALGLTGMNRPAGRTPAPDTFFLRGALSTLSLRGILDPLATRQSAGVLLQNGLQEMPHIRVPRAIPPAQVTKDIIWRLQTCAALIGTSTTWLHDVHTSLGTPHRRAEQQGSSERPETQSRSTSSSAAASSRVASPSASPSHSPNESAGWSSALTPLPPAPSELWPPPRSEWSKYVKPVPMICGWLGCTVQCTNAADAKRHIGEHIRTECDPKLLRCPHGCKPYSGFAEITNLVKHMVTQHMDPQAKCITCGCCCTTERIVINHWGRCHAA